MARVGVFVCHCGTNISATVDVKRVAEVAKSLPGVRFTTDYRYMCSEPGQDLIQKMVKEHNLTRIVVAACSPSLHEKTFRTCTQNAGLNPYFFEMANIREQCSWVHDDREEATLKAIDIVKVATAKVRKNNPLQTTFMPVEKRVLVIGGGISGIQAAIDVAFNGFETVIVEREPSIGGRMAMFDKTFPTLDCAACILTPKMVEVNQSDLIKLYTYSEVEEVSGYVGNFKVKIRKKARLVDENKCNGCGTCWQRCPVRLPSEFDMNLGKRKAIYVPFPQAVPNVPVIDQKNCLYINKKKCGICKKVCPPGAIDFEQKDEIVEETFGAIIVATGFTMFDHSIYGEYGYGKYKNVTTGLHFERMLNSSGPTGGKIIRPSDGKEAKKVVFIQCVGSRDEARGMPYCSRLCCMYTAKQALLLKEHNPEAEAYVFYIDIRAAGKNYEEFVERVQNEYGATYLRGRVSKIFQRNGKLMVRGCDTLSGTQIEIDADLVVLATALIARPDAVELAQMLHIPYDQNRLFTEAHPKLAPVETVTTGVFLTGACQSPKDIPDTVATASAASVKACGLLSHEKLPIDPQIARVNVEICSGCLACKEVCPFGAIEKEEIVDRVTQQKRWVAKVAPSLCNGCGACNTACRPGAIDLDGFTEEQIFSQIESLAADKGDER